MYWICKRCGATMTTNSLSAKPTGGNCKKEQNGKKVPHLWVPRK